MKSPILRLLAVLAAMTLVLAACGGSAEQAAEDAQDAIDNAASDAGDTVDSVVEETTAPDESGGADTTAAPADDMEMSELGLPVIDPLSASAGDIGIAGSSTVFPLSTAVLSKWEDEGGPSYAIDSIGSGGGLERFCVEGASDIANASRAIEEDEVAACEEIGRTPIEIRVGTDALSVVISSGNYFAQNLTIAEIATAFSLAETGATWADVNPEFPAHPIALFTPGADSGTFDYFNEIIFEEAEPSPILSSIAQIVGEDDNVTAQGVGGDGCTEGDTSTTCAIGYFGYAYFSENADVLQAVAVEGVAPGDDSVNEGTYPLSRPLFMYTDAGIIAEKPQVAEFIAYYLNNVNDVIGEVGYFPAPADALQGAADAVKAAAGW